MTDEQLGKHGPTQRGNARRKARRNEPRRRTYLIGIAARVALLAAFLAGCSGAGLSEHVSKPQVFEAEFLDAALGAGWETKADPEASGEMSIVAAPSTASEEPIAHFDLPFVVEAADAGETTIHLRLWAPEAKETSVTLGFDGDARTVPVTGSGSYGWIATPSANLEAGAHSVTMAPPPEGVRYDLFVVAQAPLTDSQLDALANVPASTAPPGSGPTEPDEPGSGPTQPDEPGTGPTQPDEPGTGPTQPDEPGTEPTEPNEPGTEPTEPDEPGTEPTEPDKPGTEPTEPDKPGTEPTEPDKPGTGPDKPGTEPSEPAFPSDKAFPDRRAGLYAATLEWSARVPQAKGNPFDVAASATFVNQKDGARITTDLFYDGDGTYRFRFAPTGLGRWTFEVRSETGALDGLSGVVTVVPNGDAGARGFYQAVNGKIAVPVGNNSRLHGVPYQIYMRGNNMLESVDRLPTNPGRLSRALDDALDEAENAGFSAVFVGVWNNWFSLGDPRWSDHDSVNPDPATFRILETLIERAHARGMGVHMWSWGDDQLKTTQSKVKGGIGGAADSRLQRYISARLGPIPGWTMGYGFDLHEWVKPAQVRAWADAINSRSGWSHLLTARQQGLRDMDFFMGRDQLPLVSNDIRTDPAGYRPYQDARDAFKAADGKPVLFERRFLFGRDSVWSMDATRRAMWQFTMAGGAASFWGIGWDDPTSYTRPGQLRAFREFWNTRLDVDLSPRKNDGTLLLTSGNGKRVVAYGENTRTLSLPVTGGGRAIAIDTKSQRYEEIPLTPPGRAGTWTWRAPRTGDWAIAFVAR